MTPYAIMQQNSMTLCCAESIAIPEEIEAYRITGYDRTTNTLTATRTSCADGGEGVLLKGHIGDTCLFVKTDCTQAATDRAEYGAGRENLLIGVTEGNAAVLETTDGEYTNFVLGSDGVFHHVRTTTVMEAGKAYLQLSSSELNENALTDGIIVEINGNGNTDNMSDIYSDSGRDGAWYNINGTRNGRPTRGRLYIHKGKKIAY